METSLPVVAARVAPPGYTIRPGDAVTSVGCNNGDAPTVQRSKIISWTDSLGRRTSRWPASRSSAAAAADFLGGRHGHRRLQCGRSPRQEGLFAALGSIQSALADQNLAVPLPPPSGRVGPAGAARPPRRSADAGGPAVDPFRPESLDGPARASMQTLVRAAARSHGRAAIRPPRRLALEEIHRRVKEGAEVVCIVRDRNDPQSLSQVFTLDRASPGFGAPTGSRPPDPPPGPSSPMVRVDRTPATVAGTIETSLEIPRPRTPLLEWDINAGWRHCQPRRGRKELPTLWRAATHAAFQSQTDSLLGRPSAGVAQQTSRFPDRPTLPMIPWPGLARRELLVSSSRDFPIPWAVPARPTSFGLRFFKEHRGR